MRTWEPVVACDITHQLIHGPNVHRSRSMSALTFTAGIEVDSRSSRPLDENVAAFFVGSLLNYWLIVGLSWWFGFLESPDERDCYLGVPLE